ncbi:class I SAM-dependent methyltransferase [candidate division KSB1 bacterium]|nr:class I SAM-dependent methyltransferase [candidate division KSB1 bacterium]
MSFIWPDKKYDVHPYSKLALIYNHIMSHVNYARWTRYVLQLFKKFAPETRRVLDVACGTGNFLIELHQRQYQTLGFDQAIEMVQVAQKQLIQKGLQFPLWCGNMQQFALRQPPDAIVCLYDSINYLMTLENLANFFAQSYANLNPGGVLIFDICTEWNSLANFQNYVDREQTESVRMERKSYYDNQQRIHHNDFRILFNDDPVVYCEYHQQRIYYIQEILDTIPRDKFDVLAMYDGFTLWSGSEKSERVHFVIQKRA